MKKKKNVRIPVPPPPKDHLLVHDSMTMTLMRKPYFPEYLIRTLIALCGSLGTLFVMQGFFQFPVQMKPLVLTLLGTTAVLRLIRRIAPKIGFSVVLVTFAAVPLLLLKFREQAVVGAGAIYHIMRKKILWQRVFPAAAAHAGEWTEDECVQLVILLLTVAMVALLEYSDVLLSHTQSSLSAFWIRFLVTFPFLECGLYFGIETYSIAVFMMIFFWIGTIAVARRRPGRKIAAGQGISWVHQQNFINDTEKQWATHEPAAAWMLTAALVLAAASLFTSKSYVRTDEMNQKRRELRDFYQNITIEDVTGLFQRLPGNMNGNIITDEVDLMQISDVHFDGRPALHLKIGGAAYVDDYYFRGAVRSEYTGRGWGIPSGVYRKNQRLFRRLTAENRMPQTIFHSDHMEEFRTNDGKYPVVRCEVTALNKENTNYLPYQSIFDVGTRYRYDIETELDSTEKYEFWLMNNVHFDWHSIAEAEKPSSNSLVTEYEEFAADEYLKLPDSPAIDRIYNAFLPEMPDASLPLDERLGAVRDYIWARAEYTMQPGSQPAEQDFVEYFLTTSHKGYCAHYASAAVVLCRMCGIPARYCQGYVLTRNDFEMGRSLESFDINIPDHQAHAWAEIYVKGYGWIPFEFTETVQDTWHRPIETTATETETVPISTTTTYVTTQGTGTQNTTTAPPATAGTTTATTAEGSAVPGGMNPAVSAAMIKAIKTALSILIVIVLYLTLHLLICSRREREMHSKDPNAAALASYLFLVRLLHICGIDQNKLTHDEYAAEAEKMCKLLTKGKITRAIALQQESVFSRDGISAANAKIICKTANRLAEAMYRNAKPLRKLWLRWGRHIVK